MDIFVHFVGVWYQWQLLHHLLNSGTSIKEQKFLHKSPVKAAIGLINKPKDLVRVARRIIFILQGENRHWEKSSEFPRLVSGGVTIQNQLLTPNLVLSSRSYHLSISLLDNMRQEKISAPSQHFPLNVHIQQNFSTV